MFPECLEWLKHFEHVVKSLFVIINHDSEKHSIYLKRSNLSKFSLCLENKT